MFNLSKLWGSLHSPPVTFIIFLRLPIVYQYSGQPFDAGADVTARAPSAVEQFCFVGEGFDHGLGIGVRYNLIVSAMVQLNLVGRRPVFCQTVVTKTFEQRLMHIAVRIQYFRAQDVGQVDFTAAIDAFLAFVGIPLEEFFVDFFACIFLTGNELVHQGLVVLHIVLAVEVLFFPIHAEGGIDGIQGLDYKGENTRVGVLLLLKILLEREGRVIRASTAIGIFELPFLCIIGMGVEPLVNGQCITTAL